MSDSFDDENFESTGLVGDSRDEEYLYFTGGSELPKLVFMRFL